MLAIAMPFIISQAALPYGVAVSLRFLERPTNSDNPKYTIPPESDKSVELTNDSLTNWIQMKDGRLAQGYAMRVIPLDLLYLLFFWRFLGSRAQRLQVSSSGRRVYLVSQSRRSGFRQLFISSSILVRIYRSSCCSIRPQLSKECSGY